MINTLEQECAARLAETFPTRPGSLEAARDRLSHLRGRAMRIVVSNPGVLVLPLGLWIATADLDIIWADSRTSRLHQRVIVAHEMGHMICGHQPKLFGVSGVADAISQAAAARISDAPAKTLTGLLGRCGEELPAEDREGRLMEAEAEVTGRLLVRPWSGGHDAELDAVLGA